MATTKTDKSKTPDAKDTTTVTIKLNERADRRSLIDVIGSHRSGPVLFVITIALIAAACAAAGTLSRVLLTLAILTAIVFVLRPVRRTQ